MQAVHADQMFGLQLRNREAKAGAGLGRIVFRDLALGMFGVQTQADLEHLALGAGRGDQVGETGDLGGVVEDDMVRQAQDLGQILGAVGGE